MPDVNNMTPDDINKYASLLTEEPEIDLIKKLADYPGEIKLSADNLAPYRITVYTQELASIFHSFYNKCRVLTDDIDLTVSRLFLVMAVQQVIKNALSILGITAPDRM